MNSKRVLQMSLFLNSHLITDKVGVMSNGNLCNNHCLKYICMIKMLESGKLWELVHISFWWLKIMRICFSIESTLMDIFRYLGCFIFDQCMLEIWLWNLTLLFNHKFSQPAGQVWTVNSTLINWCCTGWFITCGHYCRMCFSRSLWSKNLISAWVLFWIVMELWVFF